MKLRDTSFALVGAYNPLGFFPARTIPIFEPLYPVVNNKNYDNPDYFFHEIDQDGQIAAFRKFGKIKERNKCNVSEIIIIDKSSKPLFIISKYYDDSKIFTLDESFPNIVRRYLELNSSSNPFFDLELAKMANDIQLEEAFLFDCISFLSKHNKKLAKNWVRWGRFSEALREKAYMYASQIENEDFSYGEAAYQNIAVLFSGDFGLSEVKLDLRSISKNVKFLSILDGSDGSDSIPNFGEYDGLLIFISASEISLGGQFVDKYKLKLYSRLQNIYKGKVLGTWILGDNSESVSDYFVGDSTKSPVYTVEKPENGQLATIISEQLSRLGAQ